MAMDQNYFDRVQRAFRRTAPEVPRHLRGGQLHAFVPSQPAPGDWNSRELREKRQNEPRLRVPQLDACDRPEAEEPEADSVSAVLQLLAEQNRRHTEERAEDRRMLVDLIRMLAPREKEQSHDQKSEDQNV